MSDEFFVNRTHDRERDDKVRHPSFARALEELYRAHPCERFVDLKQEMYPMAAQVIGADKPITYLEFGVLDAWSFKRVMNAFTHPDSRFYGFDSFIGLPEAWGMEMDVGHFTMHDQIPKVEDLRASFIKGWFQNTLPDFLEKTEIKTPVLIHIDADIYSATLFVLIEIARKFPDFWFLFDEFQPDEACALYDFTRAYPVGFRFEGALVNRFDIPQNLFGRIKRMEYSP